MAFRLAVSMGDPAGIGPELVVRLMRNENFRNKAEIVVFGDRNVMELASEKFGGGAFSGASLIQAGKPLENWEFGKAQPACGQIAYEAVVAAAKAVIAGECHALLTAPVNKYAVNLALAESGKKADFSGHTELIAGLCKTEDFAMMQSAGSFRVAFVTTHIPLRDVASAVTRERIFHVAKLLDEAVKKELQPGRRPHLAMAAINPHAGENGCMGDEDERVTFPAAAELRSEGIDISDPFPPDTLFVPGTREKFDGILSMYHDQGHIPFKMLAFDRGVNSTLGLPIVRTSPDHGTAFDIAWRGEADPGSFFAAAELAVKRASAAPAAPSTPAAGATSRA